MLITTSRNPNQYLRRVSKVISLSIPNSQRINRGSLSLNKLFIYCWNKQFTKLIILQGVMDEDSILVKAYLVEKKPQLIDAHIELDNIISIRDYDPKHRIIVDEVSLIFSSEINEITKKRIKDFFRQIIQDPRHNHAKKFLVISFGIEKPNFIKGQAIQQDFSRTTLLYTIHISSPCINNEQ